jgi:hypothetical protein
MENWASLGMNISEVYCGRDQIISDLRIQSGAER